jgi:hypothetical protein
MRWLRWLGRRCISGSPWGGAPDTHIDRSTEILANIQQPIGNSKKGKVRGSSRSAGAGAASCWPWQQLARCRRLEMTYGRSRNPLSALDRQAPQRGRGVVVAAQGGANNNKSGPGRTGGPGRWTW